MPTSLCRVERKVCNTSLFAVVAAASLLIGCVDLTEPWKQPVTGTGGSGAGGSADIEVGEGGASGDIDAAAGGAGGILDGGQAEAGGGLDLGSLDLGEGGADGAIDLGRGEAGGSFDARADVPIRGTGGAATGGTTHGTGGAAAGGTAGGTGGAGKGGAGGSTGGAGSPDVGPDLGPDVATNPVDASELPSGLVAYYACEGANPDGITLADLSGNGNDGTLSIAATPPGGNPASGTGYSFAVGKVGNALVLTAAGYGYVSLPLRVFTGATDITIATWVKAATAQNWQTVFDVGINANRSSNATTGTTYMNLVTSTNSNRPTFAITTNGSRYEHTLTGTSSIPSGSWTHLAVVLGKSSVTMYVNGTAVSTRTSVTERPKDLGSIDYAWMGKSQFSSNPAFDGAFDEFRVYHRALSAGEIQALYQYSGQ